MLRRILKYCLYLLGATAAVLVLILVLMQTPWGQGMLLDAALKAVNSSISGEIRMGNVKGNLFSGMEIRSLTLSHEGEPVISIAVVRLEYDLGDLLQSRITVRHLALDSVSIALRKEEGMQWNIELAAQSRTAADTAQMDQAGVFAWRVAVDSLTIANLAATVVAKDTLASVDDLSFVGSGTYSAESLVVHCRQMAIRAENPRVGLERCTFTLKMDTTQLSLDNVTVETQANSVSGQAGFALGNGEVTFDVATGPLYPEEFRELTGDIPVTGHPVVHVSGRYVSNTLAARADLQRDQERLRLDMTLTTGHDLTYSVKGTAHAFDVGTLTGDPQAIAPLSGDFAFSGKGLVPGKMTAEGKFMFADFRLKGYELGAVTAVVSLKGEDARAQLKSDGPSGIIAVEGWMSKITGSREFTAHADVAKLDLMRLSGVHSEVSAAIDVRGVFSGPSGPVYALNVEADSVLVDTVRVDRFACAMEFDGAMLRVDSIAISRAGTEVLTRGTIDTTGYFDVVFKARVIDLSRLVPAFGFDSLTGTAAVVASARGTVNHFSTSIAVDAGSVVIDRSQIGDMSCRVRATIVRDSVTLVSAESLSLAWNETAWNTTGTLTLAHREDSLALEPITFVSGEQQITIGGSFSGNGEGDFSVSARRVDIGSFAWLISGPVLAGFIELDLNVRGSKKGVDGNLALLLDQGMYGNLVLPRLSVHAEAEDSILQWKLDLDGRAGSLHGTGTLPLGFPDTTGTGLIVRDRPFSASFITEQFDVSMLGVLEATPVLASGYLNGRIDFGGTLASPVVEGFIRLDSGAVTHPALGMDYSGIQIKLSGNGESLDLEEFSAEQGAVTGSGSITFAYGDSLRISPDITFQANDFEVLSGPPHFAIIDGDVRIHGDEEGSVVLESDITLNRSRFFLPALQGPGTGKDQDPPLLLAAAERADSGTTVVADSASRGVRLPKFKGKATLRILRGTWLRGPRLNIELSGKLEVTPEGQLMIVRGFLVVEQGTYEFYGRKFVFNQGRIDFDGESRIDPSIYFEVEYSFRTEAEENEMLIIVRGRAEKPEVQFFFNKDPISESDAISYIIFGRKVDDLNYGQQSAVTDLGNALALDLAANMVNSQLSSMVGEKLGLDVVRVSGEDNWNKAVLTAGKYVTNELYVAYERGITQSGSSSVVFESAKMEYYLMKFLYLHLIEATDKTSGVDVFLKFD